MWNNVLPSLLIGLREGLGTGLAVAVLAGHEGLDTALYLWTTIKSAGQAHGTVLGAALGILLAVLLCRALYRSVLTSLKNDRGSFDTTAGAVLIVIAAGMLADGLGESQAAGRLPGSAAHAFDLGSIDPGSWYASIIAGALNLTPVMTWLQVAGYLVLLAAAVALFARGTRAAGDPGAAAEADTGGGITTSITTASPRAPRWAVYGAIVAVPALAAVAAISVMGNAGASNTIQVAINETACGTGWTSPIAGTLTFDVTDGGRSTAEVFLINPDSNTVYAAYGTFGNFDAALNGSAGGQPEGTATPSWTGFFRIEYGLWHGRPSAELAPLGDKLVSDIHGLVKAFPGQTTPPTDLPLRTHEILENALQFQLTGIQDHGSGGTLDTLYANTQGTQAVLATVSSLIQAGEPSPLTRINQGIATVQADLKADGAGPCTTECATPTPLGELTTAQRRKVDADLSELLETLSLVPDLLEERTTA
jgi:Imelysin